MSLFERLHAAARDRESATRLWVSYGREAAYYLFASNPRDEEAIEIKNPLAAYYLNQLIMDGRATRDREGYGVSWDVMYQLLADKEHAQAICALELPPFGDLKPALRSENTLDDEEFAVAIEGWFLNGAVLGSVELSGPVAREGPHRTLLRQEVFAVLRAVQDFYADRARTPHSNRKHWGRIRHLAMLAGARMDPFLHDTVVVTPEKLHIRLAKVNVVGTGVVEVEPWFAGAPANWLSKFDDKQDVPERYEIVSDDKLIEVILSAPVRSVLRAIKKMPGRRVAGAFAEKFLSNPFATLGEDADHVIDEGQFDEARSEAGIVFQQFRAHWQMRNNEVLEAGLAISTADSHATSSQLELFSDPDELRKFVVTVESKLLTGFELCEWRGYSLGLVGDTHEQLDILKAVYARWTRPKIAIRAADVLDLKRYSERVRGIGIQPGIVSPYIPRTDQDPWFPDSRAEGKDASQVVHVGLAEGKELELVVDKKVFRTLKESLQQARTKGEKYITIPGLGEGITVEVAERLVNELASRYERSESRSTSNTAKKNEREELLIQTNIGSTDYLEERSSELKFDNRSPVLPTTLKGDASLKDHQKIGVAWLQHLLSKAPQYCRGAVLADDMGLGKTLQLLTIIAAALENSPQSGPVLIVAPVSLLENWREESEKFFQPGTFPLLTLYGDSIGRFRAKSNEIEKDLLDRGFTRFLRDDWLGAAKVVLTTYETLRDLEFSLAAVRWSMMICDEAQKIKNPAAMVTRAAKKQNAAFKIVCTGTPVENSLTDIWCLFDFIQPGLLGALNDFGKVYRRPIECETDEHAAKLEQLRAIIAPQVLRRLKRDIAKDLPEKIIVEAPRKLVLSPYQRQLYGDAIERYRLRHIDGHNGVFKNQLGLLHYLRKVCSDPREHGRTFDNEAVETARQKNPKLDWLLDALKEIKGLEEKAIIFCEFRDMQLMLAHYISQTFSIRPDIINGDTSAAEGCHDSRQKRIKEFQARSGFGVIILSPVAVGFGLNIQAANHVIHFTRTWNPAREDQATDRAYRIGQARPVYVYYPVVCADEFMTFDVLLDRLLERKRDLSGDMLNGTGNVLPNEFEDVVGVGKDAFDKQLYIEDADCLEPLHFEAMIAALCKKRGFRSVKLTSATGDGGVDVVAKTNNEGELVQVKHCSSETGVLGWDAVKEIVAGERLYSFQFPGVRFKKVALTNREFNSNAVSQARILGVELIGRSELANLLDKHRITMTEVETFLVSPEYVMV
ncbi:SNF2-related protein [Nitrospira moscoviensis]|uniref:Putative Helicase n=1 Tax=Nitrospira moscoviensis TaxID=42253 RepID=A0A0K2GFK9_NITMO|nr:SNF2-related protein [Nitrospira moscoviensis]ALA59736.1 putative Helicase [Nitrospira moscoviensis]